MADKFDIVNGALVRLGANEIASFDEDSTESMTARRMYPNVVADLLSRYPWRFMTAQVQIARMVDAPEARWDAAYQLPADLDIVKAVTIGDVPIKFDRYGDKIYCNATSSEEVMLDYVRKADEAFFPGYFCTLLEYELANAMAVPVGDRGDLSELYEKKALRHFTLAKSLDAQGRTTQRMPTGKFVGARFGRGTLMR